jgi:hypothetical protein
MPEGGDPRPSEYGHYRRVCADRQPREQDSASSVTTENHK